VERLWLVRNGVPWDEAMAMPDEERFAYAVIFSSFEGLEFDWDAQRYKERK
jgi:hypothetical protein